MTRLRLPMAAGLLAALLIVACVSHYIDRPATRTPIPVDLLPINRGAGSGGAFTPEQYVRLTRALRDAYDATGAVTMTAAVLRGDAIWQGVHGAGGPRHYWASVGKLVTAAAIFRLVDEGSLSLDQPLSAFLEGVPRGDTITLANLMNHTSGLPSAQQPSVVGDPIGQLDLPDLVAALQASAPHPRPGTTWRYSNSNYALLGAVIEDVTDRPYHLAAADLVLANSNARGVRMIAPDDPLTDVAPLVGSPPFDATAPQAAAGVAGDAAGMAMLLRELLGARLFSDASLMQMAGRFYQMDQSGLWYGLGLMAYDVPDDDGPALWLGHSGGVPGGVAVVLYAPEANATVAVALTGAGSAEATANLLLRALDTP